MPVFHLGVIGMTFFDEKNHPLIFHNIGVLITIVIFLGAIHEVLDIFIGILYGLVKEIYSKLIKVSDSSSK